MDWQQVVTLGIVAIAALLLARSVVTGRKRKTLGCGPNCRCEPADGREGQQGPE